MRLFEFMHLENVRLCKKQLEAATVGGIVE